jgi:cytochrome c oxidase cbb3-type subunit 1
MDSLVAMNPYYWTRGLSGLIYLAGVLVFVYNLVMTARSGEPATVLAAQGT